MLTVENSKQKREGGGVLTLLDKQFSRWVAHPPTSKWPLIIELFFSLTLSNTGDTFSSSMNTFCWRPVWSTGRWWEFDPFWGGGGTKHNMSNLTTWMDTEDGAQPLVSPLSQVKQQLQTVLLLVPLTRFTFFLPLLLRSYSVQQAWKQFQLLLSSDLPGKPELTCWRSKFQPGK